MLTVSPGAKVYLAVERVDLRRGHDGLCALVRGALGLDPYAGHFFVFVGKRGDRIKILFWDDSGLCLFTKQKEAVVSHGPQPVSWAARSTSLSAELGL